MAELPMVWKYIRTIGLHLYAQKNTREVLSIQSSGRCRMTLTFEFESLGRALSDAEGTAARLEIQIVVYAKSPDREAEFLLEHVWDLDRDCEVQFISLPMSEQIRITEKCISLAQENTEQAHSEWEEGLADWEYERSRDRE